MFTLKEAKEMINSPEFAKISSQLYLNKNIEVQRNRYLNGVERFSELFPSSGEVTFFSAPGRAEIAGNHTDHQRGRVIAAAIDMDAIAIAAPTQDNIIRIKSHDYPLIEISADHLTQRESEKNTPAGIVRGISARLSQLGYKIGGFNAYVASDVLPGSGLSSSAAFEVLIATILNCFYNEKQIDKVELAEICQYAENNYFGKPSGLMDQMASSLGGFVYIDFNTHQPPCIEQLYINLSHFDYSLCIVNTGDSHADLTDDYSAVQKDMTSVANHFGKDFLSQVTMGDFLSQIPTLRKKLGDRALLRAIHFFGENERVPEQAEAIGDGDFERFRQLVLESGQSSFMYNQNVFSPENPSSQSLSVGLALSETILGPGGAWRVHGGGFAGTIQAYVPKDLLSAYKSLMTSTFGENSVMEIGIRTIGGICSETLL